MAENSKIEWTDHTFNPWIGCTKVHAGCTHCYAETLMDHRYGKAKWGVNGTRNRTSEANWKKPRQWNRAAEKAGRPALVFCSSLADVFEDREDLAEHRRDLFRLVDETPNLIWLMLTKRPQNIHSMWPKQLPVNGECGHVRRNVWLGTSPCNQETANKAIPDLLKCRDICGGLFLSCEPLLGGIDLGFDPRWRWANAGIGWVIVGGESGHQARPVFPEWVRGLRGQCQESGIPFFFKQWGEWGPRSQGFRAMNGSEWGCLVSDGDFQPQTTCWNGHDDDGRGEAIVVKVGKSTAGRLLDGREWSEFPAEFQRELVAA